jgi:uncharacterized iron-regulated protein
MIYLVLIPSAVAILTGFFAHFRKLEALKWREKYEKEAAAVLLAEAKAQHAHDAYIISLEKRRELQKDLDRLHAGPAADRLDSSLDILRDSAERTAPKPAPGLADLAGTAGRHKPKP